MGGLHGARRVGMAQQDDMAAFAQQRPTRFGGVGLRGEQRGEQDGNETQHVISLWHTYRDGKRGTKAIAGFAAAPSGRSDLPFPVLAGRGRIP
jgi:hypothetical protein